MKSRNAMKTLSMRMEELKEAGYTTDFIFVNGKLRGNEKDYEAADIEVVKEFRFEGPSNPDDMSILYQLKANDGTKGSVVDGYGVSANPELSQFLMKAENKDTR